MRSQRIQCLQQRLPRAGNKHNQNADGLRSEIFHIRMQHVDTHTVILRNLADERLECRIALVSQFHDGAGWQRWHQLRWHGNAEIAFHQRFGGRMFRSTEHVERAALLHYHTVFHNGHSVEDLLRYVKLMRDEHDGNAQFAVDALQERQNAFRGFEVQSAGRLVTQENLRLVGERTRNGHALLLSA